MIKYAHSLVASYDIEQKSAVSSQITVAASQQQQKSTLLKQINQTKTFHEQLSEGDLEVINLIQLLESKSKMKIEDILQLQQGMKKIYFVENQKIITQVY